MGLKDFLKPPMSFVSEKKPVTPFDKAEATWDDRDGHLRVQNLNWRRAVYFLIFTNLFQTAGIAIVTNRSTIAPYVIEVDSTTGMAKNVGLVQAQGYVPKQAEIKYFLTEFIRNTRGVPLDPIVFRENWTRAYAYMTKGAAGKMNTLMQGKESPALKLGHITVQPTVVVIVSMSDNSYQVRWTEEEFDVNTGQKKIVPMSGVFTIYLTQPKNEKELTVNPLGIYIADFSWEKENVAASK